MYKKIVILILAFIIPGCVSWFKSNRNIQYVNPYIGKTRSEIIMTEGVPDKVFTDNDITILVYYTTYKYYSQTKEVSQFPTKKVYEKVGNHVEEREQVDWSMESVRKWEKEKENSMELKQGTIKNEFYFRNNKCFKINSH